MATGNMHKQFGEVWPHSFRVLRADILIMILRILSGCKVPRILSRYIDLHIHAGSKLCNPVTLTFDLLAPRSMHAEVLPYVYQVWCSQLIIFLSQRRHTQTHIQSQTPLITLPMHRLSATTSVGD